MSSIINVTIAIDDVHPEPGWGMEGDKCIEYLENLNKEFGTKYILFIPSNYHNKFPISEHKDWINWLKSKDYFELAAHGHYHMCERTDIGECEFYELDTEDKIKSRIGQMMKEWNEVEHKPLGWRNPGWVAHPEAVKWLGPKFKYAAIHDIHNHDLKWDCKMIYGYDGIHSTDISLHNKNIMFSSHIAGDWNDNVWNEDNYNQFKISLQHIIDTNDVAFKTINEL